MKKLKLFIKVIIALIVSLVLTLALFLLIGVIQSKLFVPEDYIIWIFKSPYSSLIFIYEFFIICFLFSIFLKDVKLFPYSISGFIKEYKRPFIIIFIISNMLLAYTILFNISVVSEDKIIDYTFFSPNGN